MYNYFLIDFVSEVFIIKVAVKENSFQLKPSKRKVGKMLNPEKNSILDLKQYIISAIKTDKVSIWYPLTLLKSFQMYHP